MKQFAVEFGPYITLIRAKTPENAAEKASRIYGSINGPYRARVATKQDIAWSHAMSN